SMEVREREITGIKSLKIGYNKVFGYYLEVTNSNLAEVPPTYIRKQTLANAERFVTEELKEYENAVLSAHERLSILEYDAFIELRRVVATAVPTIVGTARTVAILDTIQSLAELAVKKKYVRPEINNSRTITITNGRHPVVEHIMGMHAFVPNDTDLAANEISIITGPNMAGKSTYMRQVALIVLLAQMGSFVPADRAVIGIVDRIFTRVGAADDIFTGQSTFMVEMTETSLALSEATDRSLLLFDEVGRGTSTFDGMALAQAIMEYVHSKIKSRTLFSTHYHELTALSESLPRCKNYTVAVLDQGREIVFLRRVQPGKASKSYGIHVAELAGLPQLVTERAYDLLRLLEEEQVTGLKQISLFDYAPNSPIELPTDASFEIVEHLACLSCDSLTPLQALAILYELKDKSIRARK
ncbi:MAG: DNA mismatch repair protein MutS, partial [bacterium]|nr:DNA mismatch repair protein MutS [bacterium]